MNDKTESKGRKEGRKTNRKQRRKRKSFDGWRVNGSRQTHVNTQLENVSREKGQEKTKHAAFCK